MDRPALHTVYAIAELVVQALRDLAGGFVSEGEDADPGRLDPQALDEVSDPLDEAEGLARAGAGENEQRLGRGFDGGTLARRGSVCNRSGVGRDRRRISDERFVRARGLVRAGGGDRQLSVVR